MTTQNTTAPATVVASLGINDQVLVAVKKSFSTGSVGYYGNGKVLVDGQVYQASITLTLVGSKPEKA